MCQFLRCWERAVRTWREVVQELKIASQEQISQRICGQKVKVSFPRVVEQERVRRRTAEFLVDVQVPQDGDAGFSGELGVDVDRKGSFGDILVRSVMEEIVVVVQEEEKLIPQERVQQRTVELHQCLSFWKRQSR